MVKMRCPVLRYLWRKNCVAAFRLRIFRCVALAAHFFYFGVFDLENKNNRPQSYEEHMKAHKKTGNLLKFLCALICLMIVAQVGIFWAYINTDDNKGPVKIQSDTNEYVSQEVLIKTDTVYTTDTGKCYHREWCLSLEFSKHQTTVAKALKDGYLPCGNCNPPSDRNS